MSVILTRPDRIYIDYTAERIAERLLRDQGVSLTDSPGYKYLLIDTKREVEYHADVVNPRDHSVTIRIYDEDGESADLPLGHPVVEWDDLTSRRDLVRDVFLPDALDARERREYGRELASLRSELQRRERMEVSS